MEKKDCFNYRLFLCLCICPSPTLFLFIYFFFTSMQSSLCPSLPRLLLSVFLSVRELTGRKTNKCIITFFFLSFSLGGNHSVYIMTPAAQPGSWTAKPWAEFGKARECGGRRHSTCTVRSRCRRQQLYWLSLPTLQ